MSSSTRIEGTPGLPNVGDTVGGKYRVEGILGRGGMGVVLAARHVVSGKRVAVKWLLPSAMERDGAIERFIRESQVAAMIEHPNVVDIYDVGQGQGSCFLVMEQLRGRPLDDVLAQGGVSLDELLGHIIDAARGVQAAHTSGVLHRDLKPENIFICDSPDGYGAQQAKVLDFGISKVVAGAPGDGARLTETGTMLGTPYYMSPEQARGGIELDLRSDIYAMGTIVFECCTGDIPFDGDTYNELIVKIATQPAPRASSFDPRIPEALDALIARAMAHERERRYPDMAAFIEDLVEVRGTLVEASRSLVPISSRAPATQTKQGVGPDSGVSRRTAPAAGETASEAAQGAPSAARAMDVTTQLEPAAEAGADVSAAPAGGAPSGADTAPRHELEHARTQEFFTTGAAGPGVRKRRPALVIAGLVLLALLAWAALAPGAEDAATPAAAPAPSPVPVPADAVVDDVAGAPQPGAAQAPQSAEPATAVAEERADSVPPAEPEAATPPKSAPAPSPPARKATATRRPSAPRAPSRSKAPRKSAADAPSGVEASGLSGTMRTDDF